MSSELRANLEKFISHCQDLKQEDDPSGDGFTREFRDLREKQVREKEENKFPAEEGKRHVNIKKNRYKDILPYDESRVILDGAEEGEDFINASYIKGPDGKKNYIASQGPLPHTVNDFIRMLWQLKIEIVFMACRLEEGDPKKKKCEKYWVDLGQSKEFGEITVTTEEETLPMKDFYRRRICLSCDGSHHRVTQFHYIGWPDHGIPDHPSLLNIMINHMRVERKKHDIPLVVHCSAGCGRTGTICAIDYAWTLLNERKIEKDFSLYDIILKMREQRQSMVQTPDQYELVHLVMENLFTEWIKNYDMNNDVVTEQLYYNVDLAYEAFYRRCKTAPRTAEYENYVRQSRNDYENISLPALVRDPESKGEDGIEEDIYVNEDLDTEENIYTECGDNNDTSFPKPVVVPTNEYYSNANVKESYQSAAQNQVYANEESPRERTYSSCSSLNESRVVGEMYSMVDIHKKDILNNLRSLKQTFPFVRNKTRVQSSWIRDKSPHKLVERAHSYENYTLPSQQTPQYENMKIEIEKSAVKSTTKDSQGSQEKEQGSPKLPPRKYTEEEIRSKKPDKTTSRPPQTAPEIPAKENKPAAFGGTVPRRHAMKAANPSPTGTVSSHGNIQRVVYHDKRPTPDGPVFTPLHKTFVQVPAHPAGYRRQPVQPIPVPSQNVRFKIGREEMVIPNHPHGMVRAPPIGYSTHIQPGRQYVVNNRVFHGQPIGYNYRPDRRPVGAVEPKFFVLRPRH